MKRLIALIVVVTVATWVCAEERSRPQPPNPPARVPQGRPLPGRVAGRRDLIDDRHDAREALKARRPAEDDPAAEESDAAAWRAVAEEMGKKGEWKAKVYRLVYPRDDLEVTVEGNEVPAAAGIESEFRFWRCPCGRINVMGQFVVADYESNDVIDALRKDPDAGLQVTSIGPLMLHEKPRLVVVRFFGENRSAAALAKTLREALAWTGKERMAPQKVD
jgi:hypothetical protein